MWLTLGGLIFRWLLRPPETREAYCHFCREPIIWVETNRIPWGEEELVQGSWVHAKNEEEISLSPFAHAAQARFFQERECKAASLV